MGADRTAHPSIRARDDPGAHHAAPTTDDWFDVIRALLDAGARFLTVGAHAMAVHGVPRGTQHLDLWVEPDAVVQIGLPPNRIDLLPGVTGIPDFDAAWRDRVIATVREREVPFLGRAALIANKRATGRLKDLADVEALEGRP